MSSKKEFVIEAEELLSEAESLLLEIQEGLQSEVNPDTINALFRNIHTLKGISGLFGHEGLQNLCHHLENLLDDLRMGRIELTEAAVNLIFKKHDFLKRAIKEIAKGGTIDVEAEIGEIEGFRSSPKAVSATDPLEKVLEPELLKVLSEYEEHRLRENLKKQKGLYLGEKVFKLTDFDKKLKALTERLKKLGELIATLPVSEGVPEGSIGFRMLIASEKPAEEFKGMLKLKVLKEPSQKETPPVAQKKQALTDSIKSVTTTVRVDIDKLDMVLNTVGELSLTYGAIKRIEDELLEQFGYDRLVFDIHRVAQSFTRKLRELQDFILELRMVPVGQIFSRISQIVRRHSRELHKEVELKIFGEETEIDKYIAEEIVDPLMHIVRNSIDHGIEPPDERERLGKQRAGRLCLRAYQRGYNVVVEVEDDGRGMDVEKIRKKAIEKGLIPEEEKLSRKEIIELIFKPGFSTADTITEVSGRGVGMDVVKDRVSALGGYVDIETEKDSFTRISLILPITLAIIKSLLVRVGQYQFAIALSSISETVHVSRSDIQSIEGRLVYNLREEPLPLVLLNQYYGIEDTDHQEDAFIIVAGFGDRRIGLLVDEVLGSQDLVIKSLGQYLEGLKGFAGAAEVGRHEVVMVIDVESIIQEALVSYKGALS
ncbi:MAG: chemotaxis protein CheA [Nitrospirae bacterium]|nr:MAG: chemotaxis protein CheA [Nitrospirota bacterium]